jgi:hypothetical protein
MDRPIITTVSSSRVCQCDKGGLIYVINSGVVN